MATVYVTYNITGGLVDGFYMTQAAATARAATSAALAAHTGSVTIARNMEPGACYFTAASAELTIDQLPNELKREAWASHYARVQAAQAGYALAVGYPASALMKFEDFMYWTAPFAYLVAHDASLTTAKKVRWFKEMRKGPSNARVVDGDINTAIATFFALAGGLTAPTEPAAWIDPSDGSAVALNALIVRTGTIPPGTNFVTGTWIDALPD